MMLVILCTCPDQDSANQIAKTLVEQKLAACVNILPSVTSWFSWKDKIENNQELLLIIKTTEQAYLKLEHTIGAIHPYECPEIIALPIQHGSIGYLKWVNETVSV